MPRAAANSYESIPTIEWDSANIANPDWQRLYPLPEENGRGAFMSPRMACRLFWAGSFLYAAYEANPKAMMDQLPEVTHKSFKKRQWQKAFMEGFKRVLRRLYLGMGLYANCKAEEISIQALINYTTTLTEGQRQRIQLHAADLPTHSWDMNFQIIRTRAGNFESASLFDSEAPKVSTKDWFNAYDLRRMRDHQLPEEAVAVNAATASEEKEESKSV